MSRDANPRTPATTVTITLGARGSRRREGWLLVLALLLCLVSGIGASFVQTGGGQIAVKDLKWETSSGRLLSALLYTPASATEDAPAPAVVLSHGWYDSREKQGPDAIELARRGFVVLAIDMYGHGNSDPLVGAEAARQGTGVYDGVELVADLPYVDRSRIGIAGHSNGARAVNYAAMTDVGQDLVSAVLLISNNAFYARDGVYENRYGSRDVGIVADQYDEVFFRTLDDDGSVATVPREFISTPDAQSFLAFGADPADVEPPRVADTYYAEEIDGREAQRIIFTPPVTHAFTMVSTEVVGQVVDFFDRTLGAPHPFAPSAQVWPVKEAFTALGLVGIGILLVALPRFLVAGEAFAPLRRRTDPLPSPTRTGWLWFWGTAAVSVLGSIGIWFALGSGGPVVLPTDPADPVPGEAVSMATAVVVGIWAVGSGLVTLVVTAIAYVAHWRPAGVSLRALGVVVPWRTLWRTVVLAVVTVAAAYAVVFACDYFFTTDFRLWLLGLKWFRPETIPLALALLPLFLVYFVASSLAMNAFGRFRIAGRQWINTAILALVNGLPVIVLFVLYYVALFTTGDGFPGISGSSIMWIYQTLVVVIAAAVISRKLYDATTNPYLGALVNASMAALIGATSTLVSTG
jgi:hypothetical protein